MSIFGLTVGAVGCIALGVFAGVGDVFCLRGSGGLGDLGCAVAAGFTTLRSGLAAANAAAMDCGGAGDVVAHLCWLGAACVCWFCKSRDDCATSLVAEGGAVVLVFQFR